MTPTPNGAPARALHGVVFEGRIRGPLARSSGRAMHFRDEGQVLYWRPRVSRVREKRISAGAEPETSIVFEA